MKTKHKQILDLADECDATIDGQIAHFIENGNTVLVTNYDFTVTREYTYDEVERILLNYNGNFKTKTQTKIV